MDAELEYHRVLCELPAVSAFLADKKIVSVSRLDSVWRKENLILKFAGPSEAFVLKVIHESGASDELDRVRLMKKHYHSLFPDVFVYEGNAYLMAYVDGKNFFELDAKKRLGSVALCGRRLREECTKPSKESRTADISEKIKDSFTRYRTKRARFFAPDELHVKDFSEFSHVPTLPSHNDLNCANVLYNGSVKFIDPSSEGYEDTARDVGRYFASVFFNNYDRYGNDKRASLAIAEAFLSNFDEETLARARYYIGESFLSFLNFPTITVPKEILKRLTLSVLTSPKSLKDCLGDSL